MIEADQKVYDIREDHLMNYHSLKSDKDLDKLIDKIGEARYVLLGEASHGTHEFYTWRTAITKRLIKEKGFSFVAVEGDWPDCYQINRFVKGYLDPGTKAVDILREFNRWPTWMWANWEIAALVEWMKDTNDGRTIQNRVGFYGLDVYSLWESMEVIINYLQEEDPEVAKLAVETLHCFEPYQEGGEYARAVRRIAASCKDKVVNLLTEVRKRSAYYDTHREGSLNADMNALVIANAEAYYRSLVSFDDQSWNLRDSHMVSALDTVMNFHGPKAKAILWEHNSHLGDARATEMSSAGVWNVGQLLREQQDDSEVFILGFSSYKGTVIAGAHWGAPMRRMTVPPAITGSVEEIFHNDSPKNKLMFFDNEYINNRFNKWLGHRAIGVVYDPDNERGNYVKTKLSERYDALMFFEETRAISPLHLKPEGDHVPDTYPFGL